jgi:type IV secretory pathway TrbD component
MMIAAMTLGPALGMHTSSFAVGVCVALVIAAAARVQAHDPVLLRTIFRRHHKRYCPGIRKPFVIRERL